MNSILPGLIRVDIGHVRYDSMSFPHLPPQSFQHLELEVMNKRGGYNSNLMPKYHFTTMSEAVSIRSRSLSETESVGERMRGHQRLSR
ncbi:hypothetical protein CDAR_78441 [Caerostris darwini]|uniref:Uncharacterized protein n=1 Tax=Caerostris darwini TaxID=1538125 RepID=A0AAV4SEV0_9ARAC|nr:hypothetical protein CDAR_78441 [Caerostris darwini]